MHLARLAPRPTRALVALLTATTVALTGLAASSTGAAVAADSATPATSGATPAVTTLFEESFRGTTAPGFVSHVQRALGSDPATPYACLSAATTTATGDIPACGSRRDNYNLAVARDTPGQGALRLTEAYDLNRSGFNRVAGYVYRRTPLPIAAGLDITFNSYQWRTRQGEGPGDGLGLVLTALDPRDARVTQIDDVVGGGDLGYRGIDTAWMGFGLDVYGGTSAAGSGNGCSALPAEIPQPRAWNALVVRGPGVRFGAGYCRRSTTLLGSTQTLTDGRPRTAVIDAPDATTRPDAVPVEVAINPSASPAVTASGLVVPARSWLAAVTPYGEVTTGARGQTIVGPRVQRVTTGDLPSATDFNRAAFTNNYYDPTTGLPHKVGIGWTASNGAATEIHEIADAKVTTLTNTLATFAPTADVGDGEFAARTADTVTLSASLTADSISTRAAVTTTATFPPGLVPAVPTGGTQTCAVAGQKLTCTYTPTAPIAAGGALPEIVVPVVAGPYVDGAPADVVTTVQAADGVSAAGRAATRVVRRTQAITGFDLPDTQVAGAELPLVATGGTSGAAVDFATSSEVCRIDGTTLVLLRAGDCVVTADQAGDADTYAAAPTLTETVAVTAQPTSSALDVDPTTTYGDDLDAFVTVVPADAPGTVRLTVDGQPGVTAVPVRNGFAAIAVRGADGSPLAPGDHQVQASFTPVDPGRYEASATATLATMVEKIGQAIDFTLPATAEAQSSVALTATGGASGNSVTYAVAPSSSRTCSVSGTTLQLLRAGSCVVTASQAGDATHADAVDVVRTVAVALRPTTIAVDGPARATYGERPTYGAAVRPEVAGTVQVLVDGIPGVSVTAVPGRPVPLDLGGTPLPAGVHTIGAIFTPADADALAASSAREVTLVVAPAAQTIALELPEAGRVGDTVTLAATGGGSGNPVAYRLDASGTPGACTVDGSVLRLTGAGDCVVSATQAGDADHLAAETTRALRVSTTPTATSVTPGLTTPFGTPTSVDIGVSPALPGVVVISVDGVPTGQPVAIDRSGRATTALTAPDGSTLPVGEHAVRAVFTPADTTTYAGSTSPAATVTVVRAAQAVSVDLPMSGQAGQMVLVTATGGASGQPVRLTLAPESTPGACEFDGATLWLLTAGTCAVTASQSGNGSYEPAAGVTRSITIDRVPTRTTVTLSPTAGTYGAPVTATAVVEGGLVGGTVQFVVDGNAVGDRVTVVDGRATSALLTELGGRTLAVGRHEVSARFDPVDPGVKQPSSAPVVALVVDRARTTTALAVRDGLLVATVDAPGAAGATDAPSGAVSFTVAGVEVGTASLRGGSATLARALTAAERATVAASYGGDGSFLGSSSSPVATEPVTEPVVTATVTSRRSISVWGWYRSPVRVSFTCTPGSAPLVGPCPAPVVLTRNAASQSVTRTVTATDGGTATVNVDGIDIDRVRPRVGLAGVAPGHRYREGAPRGRCQATDALSGVVSCTVARTTRGDRVRYVARAVDAAGNVSIVRTTVVVGRR